MGAADEVIANLITSKMDGRCGRRFGTQIRFRVSRHPDCSARYLLYLQYRYSYCTGSVCVSSDEATMATTERRFRSNLDNPVSEDIDIIIIIYYIISCCVVFWKTEHNIEVK